MYLNSRNPPQGGTSQINDLTVCIALCQITDLSESYAGLPSACSEQALVYVTPEEQLRRLAYCIKFLPSPLYKKERLMPTNPEAQRRFAVRDEERPTPSISIPAREKRKRGKKK
ncbi:unnamed protein product [Ranitomeya imitator]|uniref:Uncharacterized protein n=1 Tax=Ranitomeya imitator TaxID=111125 RepID=A0ABN9LA59_9NEOB|nr:unnamed protein product [Ranitomeya imitator]